MGNMTEDSVKRQIEGFKKISEIYNAQIQYKTLIEEIKNNENKAFTKLIEMIDKIIFDDNKDQFVKTIKKGEQLYRARIINPCDLNKRETGISWSEDNGFSGYNEENSREPILGISGNGRNNIQGVSYLYVASKPETACMEVKPQRGSLISLATFSVLQERKVIDFSTDKFFEEGLSNKYNFSLGVFFTKLMSAFFIPVSNETEYRVTQLVSDHLRKTGIDGIAYLSAYVPGGINYTIFNSHANYIEFNESKILIHKNSNHSFWDFNEDKELLSNPDNKEIYYEETCAEEMKSQLKEFLNCNNKSNTLLE